LHAPVIGWDNRRRSAQIRWWCPSAAIHGFGVRVAEVVFMDARSALAKFVRLLLVLIC